MRDEGRMYMIPENFCVVYHYFVDMDLIRFRTLSMICFMYRLWLECELLVPA
jgi:hypothetical protein